MRRHTFTFVLTFVGAAAVVAVLGVPHLAPAPVLGPTQSPEERAAIRAANDLSLAFQSASRRIAPSVVNIVSTERVAARADADQRNGLEDPFGWLPPERRGGNGRFFERRGQGSGVITRADGYILTNNHVVAQADKVTVTLPTGQEYTAEVVGTDRETDLAVIKIDANGLTPARFGTSADLHVGQWVIAVGAPFGLEQSVTAGIVSATGRSNLGIASYENFIQTDAAINPGNSGGPLVNLQGEVIGLNTAISTRSGAYEGIGFAIPSDMARKVLESILEEGRVIRGWLGVSIRPLDEDLADSFGFPSTEGVLITDVTRDGPAEAAGLMDKDIVVELNGHQTADHNDLRNRIAEIRPGQNVELRVFREGRERTVTVRLGERPGMDELAAMIRRGNYDATLGISVQSMTPELAERLGARDDHGVIVNAVTPGSLADRVGLEVGDIILEFGRNPIEDVRSFRRALRDFDPDESVRIRVQRKGTTIYLMMK